MGMAVRLGLGEIRAAVAAFSISFDPASISPAEADRVREEAAAIENIAATLKALAARRAADDGSWRREGARSPAHDLARKTGTSVARAREALETADRLASLPALDAAARRGEVSAAQAAPIAEAATADPAAEHRLLAKAKRASFGELRDECARVKAAAEHDDEARHRAIHATRHLRHRRCPDGAAELQYRSTVDEVAEVLAVVRGYGNQEFDLARCEGRREPEEAYLADGLLAACRAAGAVAGAGTGEAVAPTTSRPDLAGREA